MDFIKETLDWVNRERKARHSLPPLDDIPKGCRNTGYHCPLTHALPAYYVGGGLAIFEISIEGSDNVNLPPYAQEFVRAFDRGELSQYDERA